MNTQQFTRAAGVSDALAQKWFPHISVAMRNYDINTPLRQAHFIAQVGTESNGFRSVQESMNYSVAGLSIFGSRITAAQREQLGRKPNESALSLQRQMAIANIVYGGRYGNNLNGDGWNYRGRGLKQITFRANYAECGKALGIDLLGNPDLLLQDNYAALSAGWFWMANNCNAFADADDITGLTKVINGGSNGLEDRKSRYAIARRVLAG